MTCVLCGGSFAAFATHGLPPRVGRCPLCGSKGRHRALALFARERLLPRLSAGGEVLEIGPSATPLPHIARAWSAAGARYTAIDLNSPSRAGELVPPNRFVVMDARRMDLATTSLDVVVCANVLAFAREDGEILAEIRRVLKPSGLAILNVHRIEGPTLSAAEYAAQHPDCTPDFLRENGTAWFYGDDYGARLAEAGLEFRELERPVPLDAHAARDLGLERQPTLTLAARDRATVERWLGVESGTRVGRS
jgi:SAM-dependent methyltransferase